jgi:hypothetical protein
MSVELRERLDQRYTALDLERSTWVPHWRELSEYIMPRRGRFLWSDVNKGNTNHYNKIIDNTATLAARTLAAGMMAGVTSPARPWFRLGTPDTDLVKFSPVKQWLYDVEKIMRDAFQKSNIYNGLHQLYAEKGTFGTGAMAILEDDEDKVRAYQFTTGSYMAAMSERMAIDTLYRDCTMSVRQVVNFFGYDKCSQATKNLYDNKKYDAWVPVRHAVEPNTDRDPEYKDAKNKAFMSVYWEHGAESDKILRVSGFDEFAIMAPRWDVTGNDVYGTGCGTICLGDVKQLQTQQKQKGKGIEKMVNPAMNAPASMKNTVLTSLPGGVNFIDSVSGGQKFEPAYSIDPRITELREDMFEVQKRIKDAYHENLFLMLSNSDRREITAREVEERHEEKLIQLGPVLEREQDELLDPLIDRVFAILLRNGKLPPPPRELAGVEIKVEYISLMAQAQKSIGIGSIERFTGYVGQVSAVNQNVLDNIDFDETVNEYGELVGLPPRLIRAKDDVTRMRRERAKQQQQLQQAALSQQSIEGAKVLSETNTESKNALTDMMGV